MFSSVLLFIKGLWSAAVAKWGLRPILEVVAALAVAAGLAFWYHNVVSSAFAEGKAAGISQQDKLWQSKWTDSVNAANKKTAAVQAQANESAALAGKTISDLTGKLEAQAADNAALRNKMNTSVYNAQGKKLVCQDTSQPATPGTEVQEIYLGKDFSSQWNAINDAVNSATQYK